jgi:hypothetical protein
VSLTEINECRVKRCKMMFKSESLYTGKEWLAFDVPCEIMTPFPKSQLHGREGEGKMACHLHLRNDCSLKTLDSIACHRTRGASSFQSSTIRCCKSGNKTLHRVTAHQNSLDIDYCYKVRVFPGWFCRNQANLARKSTRDGINKPVHSTRGQVPILFVFVP